MPLIRLFVCLFVCLFVQIVVAGNFVVAFEVDLFRILAAENAMLIDICEGKHNQVMKGSWTSNKFILPPIDPCDIRHVGRRNNTIYLLWEIESIVMQNFLLFCLPTWRYVAGVCNRFNFENVIISPPQLFIHHHHHKK